MEGKEIRIVLVGKTGVGKSKTGNSLLKKNVFESKNRPGSQTLTCSIGERDIGKHGKLVVIDTPGLFDTRQPNEVTFKEISRCIHLAAPGPHLFLFVLSLARFTKEEYESFNYLKEGFGGDVDKFLMVVFTNRDSLIRDGDTIEEWLRDASTDLKQTIAACGNNYVAIDNVDPKNTATDVDAILNKIYEQAHVNNYYTNSMFQVAARMREEFYRTNDQRNEEIHVLQKKLKDANNETNALTDRLAQLEDLLKYSDKPYREYVQESESWFAPYLEGLKQVASVFFNVVLPAIIMVKKEWPK